MNNKQVMINFLEGIKGHTPTRNVCDGIYTHKIQTLKTDGKDLINYNTIIAYKENNNLYINIKKYSVTTSKIQNQLKELSKQYNYNIIEYNPDYIYY